MTSGASGESRVGTVVKGLASGKLRAVVARWPIAGDAVRSRVLVSGVMSAMGIEESWSVVSDNKAVVAIIAAGVAVAVAAVAVAEVAEVGVEEATGEMAVVVGTEDSGLGGAKSVMFVAEKGLLRSGVESMSEVISGTVGVLPTLSLGGSRLRTLKNSSTGLGSASITDSVRVLDREEGD